MTRHPRWINLLAALLIVALLTPLLTYAYIGFFTRYMGDDYCTAASVQQDGFIKAQIVWYMSWSGRFAFWFAVMLAEMIGPGVVPFLPAVALACWIVGAVWLVYQIAVLAQCPRPFLLALIISGLIIFATLQSAPHLVQSLYWQSGMLTYTVPLVVFTIYVAVIVWGVRQRLQHQAAWPALVTTAVLTLIAGGFSEVFALMQVGVMLIAALGCYQYGAEAVRRAAFPLIAAGLGGSLVALCLVVLAPSNSARQGYFPAPPNLLKLTMLSLYYAAGFIALAIYRAPLTTLLCVLLPALLSYYYDRVSPSSHALFNLKRVVKVLLLPLIIGFVLILMCTVPGVYGTSGFMPERARLIPQFVIVCVAVYGGYVAGLIWFTHLRMSGRDASWPVWLGAVAVGVLLLFSPLTAARRTLALRDRAKEGAALWEQMDRDLRAAKAQGVLDVTVPAVDDIEARLGAHRTEFHLERDTQNWKNRCVAKYYGLRSVKAE